MQKPSKMSLMHVIFLALMLPVLTLGKLFVGTKNIRFTAELIHRDSPNSPLYNPTRTPLERYNNALKMSTHRISTLLSSENSFPETQVISDYGDFIMEFSIGSPPTKFYGIADTGSDLTWVQCLPCISCKKQKLPLFNPNNSTTYKKLPCTSQQCDSVQHICPDQSTCQYTYAYAGGSYTVGSLATETLTLTDSASGKPYPFPNMAFGCGYNNTGIYSVNQTGIFGLGGGPLSMVSQIGSAIGSVKFSQCLVPTYTDTSISSKLIFGVDVNSEGKSQCNGVVSTTPLVPTDDKTLYFVTLKGFSVGDKFVPFNAQNEPLKKGNMFLDSGTVPVILPQDLHSRMVDAVKSQIRLEPNPGPGLCYNSESEIEVPVITSHFDGGADVTLNPINSFIPTGNGVYCFTMTNATTEVGVYGNYAQVDFSIGFDLEKKTVSFKRTDCTKNQ